MVGGADPPDRRGRPRDPDGRLHELELGTPLTRGQRPALRRLAYYAGIRPDHRLKRFMRKRMSPGSANQERWRQGLSAREQAEIDASYRDVLAGLERDGVTCAPLLRRAYERSLAA